jgi:putative oxidoreductase
MKKKKDKSTQEPKKKSLILRWIAWKLKILEFFSPLSLVALRIYVALAFWRSGLTKLTSWDNTVFLFESEYMTHKKITFFGSEFLTPEMVAYAGTFAELVFPILLITGLAGRFAASGLLIMIAVIRYTYAPSPEDVIWGLMLLPILTIGPGKASWDYFIKATFYGEIDSASIKQKLFAILCTLTLTLYAAFLIFTDVIQMQ